MVSDAEVVVEGLLGFFGYGFWGLVEVVGDFEYDGGGGWKGGDVAGEVGPIDGAGGGPEVFVLGALVVVQMELGDARAEELEGGVDAFAGGGRCKVGMADVERDADGVEVADLDDLEQVLGGGDFVLQILEEDLDAERVGEGLEVLDGGEGVLEGAGAPGFVLLAEVEGDGGKGNLFGGLDGALDLVHGLNAAGLLDVDEVDGGGDVAGPVSVGVERLVEGGGDAGGAEPVGYFAHDGAVGVVKVVAGGEDLDGAGAAAFEGIEQAGAEALLEEDVCGDAGNHSGIKVQEWGDRGYGRCGGMERARSSRIGTHAGGLPGLRFSSSSALRERRMMVMKKLRSVVLLASVPVTMGMAQAAPAAQAAAPASDPAVARMKAQLMDWAQLERYRAENAALGTAGLSDRVVFYGDSITDAWGRSVGSFFQGKPYVNRGISGQTTPQMLVRFRQDVINLHPTAVVILAGTNDIAGNTGPETPEMIEDNFKSMADLAKANGIRVVFSSILPVADYPWKPGLKPAPKIQALNAWLAGYCVNHTITYLDYYTAMTDANGGMKAGLSSDGVHPTAAGYAIMGPLAQAAVDKAIGPR